MLRISGITPFTTIDFPGYLSSVLFCQGCSWRCDYCHNRHLQPFTEGLISWNAVLHFLEERKGFIEAVVFSGGEPTQQKDLDKAMTQIKEMGYKIGLHTAGVYPEGFSKILHLVDWVGMDIKAPFESYEKITHVAGSGEKAKRCAEMLIQSKVRCEFRTTVHPDLLSQEEIKTMVHEIIQLGVKDYVIQPFRDEGKRDEKVMQDAMFSSDFFDQFKANFDSFFVR